MKTIAVFASGNGSNFEALAAACADGRIAARIALMVCDKPGAFVNERAARYGIPTFTFNPKEYPSKADYEREIVRRLRAERVELICLAGYMRILSDVVLEAYRDRSSIFILAVACVQGGACHCRCLCLRRQGLRRDDPLCERRARRGPDHRPAGFRVSGERSGRAGSRVHAVEHPLYVETVAKLVAEQ